MVVIFVDPAHVLSVVFSTLFSAKSFFTSAAEKPCTPFAVNLAYSPDATFKSSIFTAFVFEIPNVITVPDTVAQVNVPAPSVLRT